MRSIQGQADRQPTRRARAPRAGLLTFGILVFGVAVAACGGGPSTSGLVTGSTTTTIASSSPGSPRTGSGLLAYSSCMRSHGVPRFPDPTTDGGIPKDLVVAAAEAVSNSQFVAAQNDCRRLLPAGGSLSGESSQTITAQDQQDYLKAAACMRSQGITNFPDPVFSGGSVNFPEPPGADTSSTQFDNAQRICERFIPAGLPYHRSQG